MSAPHPAPTTSTWVRTQTASGAWRLEHVAIRSMVFVARNATEAEIVRRLAEADATTARLVRRRAGG